MASGSDNEEHGEDGEVVEGDETEDAGDVKAQPIFTGIAKDAGGEEKGSDHEEESDAALAELEVEVRRWFRPGNIAEHACPDGGMVAEDREGEVAAEAVEGGDAAGREMNGKAASEETGCGKGEEEAEERRPRTQQGHAGSSRVSESGVWRKGR